MTQLSCELTWVSLLADSDVSNTYTSYEAYVSSPSTTTYSALQSKVATAKNTLGVATDTTTVLGILTDLGASLYSTYLANAQTMASDVTTDAASLPTYTVSLHLLNPCHAATTTNTTYISVVQQQSLCSCHYVFNPVVRLCVYPDMAIR